MGSWEGEWEGGGKGGRRGTELCALAWGGVMGGVAWRGAATAHSMNHASHIHVEAFWACVSASDAECEGSCLLV